MRLDTLVLDEPTDGFSPEQVQRMGELLGELGIPQVVLVSHEALLNGVADRVVRVRKEAGVSELVEERGPSEGGAPAAVEPPGGPEGGPAVEEGAEPLRLPDRKVRDLQGLGEVVGGLQPDDRTDGPGGRASELERGLRPAEPIGRRSLLRELSLEERHAREAANSEVGGGLEERPTSPVDGLVAEHCGLGHREVERELDEPEAVVGAADIPGDPYRLLEAQVPRSVRPHLRLSQVAIP